jgi:hypothetical protein
MAKFRRETGALDRNWWYQLDCMCKLHVRADRVLEVSFLDFTLQTCTDREAKIQMSSLDTLAGELAALPPRTI